jgi:drug/metabolite transporter (DMT)-like permease
MLALGLRLAATAAIATMFMLVKIASQSGVALPEIMFWRQAVCAPILLGYLGMVGGLDRLKTSRMGSHARRSALGMAGMLCNFGAAILLPLAEYTTLSFTAPMFAVILTALVLREHVGPWRWTAVLCGFAGVIVIAQPGHQPIALLGATTALAAALLNAVISFQIRDLGRTEEPIRVVFYFALFGSAIMALFLPFSMTAHTGPQWLMLMGVGITGMFGQLLMTAALRYGAVASVIVMDYISLIWATGYGWLLWDQLPPAATWLGAPLIIAAGLLITWREHRLARIPSPVTASELD